MAERKVPSVSVFTAGALDCATAFKAVEDAGSCAFNRDIAAQAAVNVEHQRHNARFALLNLGRFIAHDCAPKSAVAPAGDLVPRSIYGFQSGTPAFANSAGERWSCSQLVLHNP
ncbi:MAG: hypothetical protein EPO07_09890 [Verrucomicrobia bacterium]|nr:MAG: hypothetical protein EPO07_09890 [Verrucomicrobiota bacterium]